MASLLTGAKKAEGTVVIIDVFRAFTTASIAFSRGVDKIVLVAEIEEALELRAQGVGDLCMGEVGGIRPEAFDFGNSPSQLARADVRGKTIIQSTRAGTVGVSSANRADAIYGGSLVGAMATAKAIRRENPALVTIVAMGSEGRIRSDEDEQCGLYLRNLLQGRQPDHEALKKLILVGEEAQKYGDPERPHFPADDREMALDVDSIQFAIKISRENGLLTARKVPV